MKWTAGFLVIRLQPGDWRWDLVLPFPLFVIEDALEAVASLLRLGLWFGWPRALRDQRLLRGIALPELVRFPAAFLRELRAHGPFVLADVHDGRARVSVRIV